ncbi:MAG: AAA family ATPase [Pirellulales bacterium]
MNTRRRIVYLMRGLPSSGKSHRALRLAGDEGVVLETDRFFCEVGDDGVERYVYHEARLDDARAWNFQRFNEALALGRSPIVVDRGNGLNDETRRYARLARDRGYEVELAEPDSPWWQDIRVLLKYRPATWPVLEDLAQQLHRRSRLTHRVPLERILKLMRDWRSDLTIQQILDDPPQASSGESARLAPPS